MCFSDINFLICSAFCCFFLYFFVTFRHTINLTWNRRGEREEALAIVFNDTLSRSRLDICNVAGRLVRWFAIVFRFDVV